MGASEVRESAVGDVLMTRAVSETAICRQQHVLLHLADFGRVRQYMCMKLILSDFIYCQWFQLLP